MTTRRDFIRTSGLTVAGLAIAGTGKLLASSINELSYVKSNECIILLLVGNEMCVCNLSNGMRMELLILGNQFLQVRN